MPTTVPTVPHCSQCGGVKLRSTPPTKTGCYRICSACDHMWHEPTAASLKTAAALKKKTGGAVGRAKKRPPAES